MPFSFESDWIPLALYAVFAAIVLRLAFKIPRIGRVLQAVFSVALLAFALFILLQRAPFDPNLSRVTTALGIDRQLVTGSEVRIPLASNGHFWAVAQINGVQRRMLVDSGATVTALTEDTARLAGVERDNDILPVMVQTANGTAAARTGTVERLSMGGIEARHLKVVVSPGLATDILGMNFLSQLAAWRVEGGTLILTPKPPQ